MLKCLHKKFVFCPSIASITHLKYTHLVALRWILLLTRVQVGSVFRWFFFSNQEMNIFWCAFMDLKKDNNEHYWKGNWGQPKAWLVNQNVPHLSPSKSYNWIKELMKNTTLLRRHVKMQQQQSNFRGCCSNCWFWGLAYLQERNLSRFL